MAPAHVERFEQPTIDPDVPQRGGMTVDHAGKQEAFGYIPPAILKTYGPDTRAGALAARNLQIADTIGRRLHEQNEDAREAIAKGKDPALSPSLPSPEIRKRLLESNEKELEAFEAEVAKAKLAHRFDEDTVQPFDTSKYGVGDHLRDQELRRSIATMPVEQRRKILLERRPNYMRAILGSEPELSGMTVQELQMLKNAELEARMPEVVAELNAFEQVIAAADTMTVKALRKALEAERKALGLGPTPAPTRLSVRKWK
jgi:hypothetical protein